MGIAIAICSYFFLNGFLIFWGVMGGTLTASIGAYAESANTHRLKPFDNDQKRAKESHKKDSN
ncbi:hypothetical protein FHW67_004242 [Herbaspirillum sp. Sphag1AN]|uniref:hypothetical protein n=1 Tax=unclassified Herbaspirillum TaxID=2624150 RepID=UPI00161558A5|nr:MULTISPECIES: hypothetical protein [unclassified Herbaspirillum]MBB3214917.1 hypothetical protein [Herbaspirillum sp. Sphag1AN]MBB3248111.1 hypothetical protein [Herbaspirillum sp. Sphag64]